jgi:hypothetical protein
MSTLKQAILCTIAYADMFNYPLTRDEIHWYLWGTSASLKKVGDCLRAIRSDRKTLAYVADSSSDTADGFYTLPGREAIVPIRQKREALAGELWTRAGAYAHLIALLPFVRMVALTGSLAVGNVEPGADIDYLIITEPKRLWLVRASVIMLGRCVAARGEEICPNYLLSENALVFMERNFYTAHEFAQMIPLYGMKTYRRLQASNSWVRRFLPNANGLPHLSEKVLQSRPAGNAGHESHSFIRNSVEALLRAPLIDRLEVWEMNRKLPRFTRQGGQHRESNFSSDCCKGHFNDHMARTLECFNGRLAALAQGPLGCRLRETGALAGQEMQVLHV